MTSVICNLLLSLLLLSSTMATGAGPARIIIEKNAPEILLLAAKEVRRYIYVRTGLLLPIVATAASSTTTGNAILISTKEGKLLPTLKDLPLPGRIPLLKPQEYLLHSIKARKGTILLVCGGDDVGALYGAYRFVEHLGIRFYPDGDVIPDGKTVLDLSHVDETGEPLFAMRGIQPFHDFAEGPDWWNLDDYKSVLSQLAKMRMNFIGFHTYPEFGPASLVKAEPIVWIGTRDQIGRGGNITAAYPVLHSHTLGGTWGYGPGKTSGFSFGGSLLFDDDDYGAAYIKGRTPWPHTEGENIDIFDEVGGLLDNAFTFARRLGIKTCVGTEVPITVPERLKKKLASEGKDDRDGATIKEVYRGVFSRIMQRHPLDYYWFWTPEGWTWEAVKDTDIERTKSELLIAAAAAEELKTPFTLATCGWVLGPPRDRAEFDSLLPKTMPFSCISRTVGFAPVEPGFMKISNRPKWQISWMEDDPALTSPQLWAGRVRRDAVDAFKYGCTGLMGIHWRTRILSPNFGALAQAAWGLGPWRTPDTARHLQVNDFYLDWATAQFGGEVAQQAADIFSKIDGGKGDYHGNLYRASTWSGPGPGLVFSNPKPWGEIGKEYEFVDAFADLAGRVKGIASKERFDYWLNTFRFARAMGLVGCVLGEIDTLVKTVQTEKDRSLQATLIRERILPLKAEAEKAWGAMVTYLLSTVNTPGEMGTVANLELRSLVYHKVLSKHDSLLSALLNEPLPASHFWKEYRGPDRIVVPTKRSVLEKGEGLRLKAIALTGKEVTGARLYWRSLGGGRYRSVPLRLVRRSSFVAEIPGKEINGRDFEFYVEVQLRGARAIQFPAAEEKRNQTVVVY